MRKQHGVSLSGLIFWLVFIGFFGLLAAKLLPFYLEFFSMKKMFVAMDKADEFSLPPNEIRRAWDRRNAIEDIRSVTRDDLDIHKNPGGETVVTATWTAKVPLVYNINACLDFVVTNEK